MRMCFLCESVHVYVVDHSSIWFILLLSYLFSHVPIYCIVWGNVAYNMTTCFWLIVRFLATCPHIVMYEAFQYDHIILTNCLIVLPHTHIIISMMQCDWQHGDTNFTNCSVALPHIHILICMRHCGLQHSYTKFK